MKTITVTNRNEIPENFTGVVKIKETKRNYNKSIKSKYSSIIKSTEWYKEGTLHRTDGPAIEYTEKYINQQSEALKTYKQNPSIYYPNLPPVQPKNQFFIDGKNITVTKIDIENLIFLGKTKNKYNMEVVSFLSEDKIIEIVIPINYTLSEVI